MKWLRHMASTLVDFFRDVRDAIRAPSATTERLVTEIKDLKRQAAEKKARKRTP